MKDVFKFTIETNTFTIETNTRPRNQTLLIFCLLGQRARCVCCVEDLMVFIILICTALVDH